ncbi:MAG: M50 family metallopeptidase [Bacteroidales bacterium]|nr:M50 family metallopeptidase [Bacteroidales bacterium]
MSSLLVSHIDTTMVLDFVKSNWLLMLFFALGFLLPRIPVVGKFFNIINTALHEFGHALMALLTGGSVERIELFNDTSGSTTTKSDSKVGAFLVSIAGYPFAASVAWLAFYLIGQGAEKGLVIGLSVLFVLMLLFWIRNWYGVLWVLLFCAVNGVLLYYGNASHLQYAALFYAAVILAESVTSSITIVVLALRDGNKAGDATNLAKLTHLPAFLWALLFLAYTGWVSYRMVLMLL